MSGPIAAGRPPARVALELIHRLEASAAAGWSITVNEHRQMYQSVEAWAAEFAEASGRPVAAAAVLEEMIRRDRVVLVRCYLRPDGFVEAAHWDLKSALSLAADAAAASEAEARRLVVTPEYRAALARWVEAGAPAKAKAKPVKAAR